MNNTNLVEWILDTLAANWDSGVTSQPALINRDESSVHTAPGNGNYSGAVGEPNIEWDLSVANAISVASAGQTNSPSGFGYNHLVTAEVDVRVEAVHEDEWGHVVGDDEFKAIVREAKRALLTDRGYPIPGEYHTLLLPDESPGLASHKDYYRTDLTAEFRGYSELP